MGAGSAFDEGRQPQLQVARFLVCLTTADDKFQRLLAQFTGLHVALP